MQEEGLVHTCVHTHTLTILAGNVQWAFPLEPEPLPGPRSHMMPHGLCFSSHPEKWKPVPLIRGKDTVSIKPEKHNLLRACFQFQAMSWKGQLIWIFRKSKIIKWEGLGILGLSPTHTLLMKKIRVYSYDWQTATFFYWTCLYSLKKEDVLERRLRGIYVAENL